jgi:hypothetical protein
MSRETEFLTRHKEDLTQAAEMCRTLQRQAVEVSPRHRTYLRLLQTCKRLEGTCRQMAHERGDDFTWLQLGHHYHAVSRKVTALRHEGKWLLFGKLAEVFEAGMPQVGRLATTATGLTSMSTSPLLILPPYLRGGKMDGRIIVP